MVGDRREDLQVEIVKESVVNVTPCRRLAGTLSQASSLLGLALALVACGSPRAGQTGCTTSADCKQGFYCDAGTCAAGSGAGTQSVCARDADCAPEDFCDLGAGGECKPRDGSGSTDKCTKNDDCKIAGQFCKLATGTCVECLNINHCDDGLICRSDGTCGELEVGCTSDDDCAGLHCDTVSGSCVQCVSSGQCPSGQTCRDFMCVSSGGGGGGTDGGGGGSGNPSCASQTDCDSYGKICDPGSNECVDCEDDSQCGSGRRCAAGTCTQAPNGGGGGGGGGAGSCLFRDDCNGQACFDGECQPCFSDFMCADATDLFTGATKMCDVDSGSCVDPQCYDANDCPTGQACWGIGHCGECLFDDECRVGETCNWDTGVCEAAPTPPECTSNSECSGGMVCVSNSCAACSADNQCNAGDKCGTDGRCYTPAPQTGTRAFGETCSASNKCSDGLICLTMNSKSLCTRPCIGSGNGGDADCPSGYGCYNFESGSLDGTKMCVATSQVSADFPGVPFTLAPGSDCSSGNACQTSICYSDSQECARACLANRDCDTGDVCYAVWADDGSVTLGDHLCYYSDTENYLAAGAICSSGLECDSGLCAGTCSQGGTACNSDLDCDANDTCSGTCVDHCRSNSDCSSTDACTPWPTLTDANGSYSGWVPACLPKYYNGTQANGTTCSDHSDCKSDWCVSGICTSPCGITADCTGSLAGKACKLVTFTNSNNQPSYAMTFCL